MALAYIAQVWEITTCDGAPVLWTDFSKSPRLRVENWGELADELCDDPIGVLHLQTIETGCNGRLYWNRTKKQGEQLLIGGISADGLNVCLDRELLEREFRRHLKQDKRK